MRNITSKNDAKGILSQAKFFESYSRFLEDDGRYETWEESVKRVMDMHRGYYADKMTPELEELIDFAEDAYMNKLVLGSQRALQFGGEQLLKNHARLYNCTASYIDRPEVFGELFFLMLSGCGVGFSVQQRHIKNLPNIVKREEKSVDFIIPDSIEGWKESADVLLSSFFINGGNRPEFKGKRINFIYDEIRPAGALVSGGFKAPGPDGLKSSIGKIEDILIKATSRDIYNGDGVTLKSVEIYDIVMHIADAVLSGGIRRAATICLFSHDDEDMLTCKSGPDWFRENPQRSRSNNSAMLLRNQVTKEEFLNIIKHVKDYGEPGFIWVDNLDALFNPCVEIGLYGYSDKGESGFGVCNLVEQDGSKTASLEVFKTQCKASSILGTLQAGYTKFTSLSQATIDIVEYESLLGISITGWMNNPDILFDDKVLEIGSEIAIEMNERVAKMIDINPAARLLTVKPSGNASVILGCGSGIHGEHDKNFLRHAQFNKETEIAKLFIEHYPSMVEQSVYSETDIVVAFPIAPSEGSIFKSDLLGVKQLEYVVKAQKSWVAKGTKKERSLQPWLVHNVSNTITVDDWDAVGEFIYENRAYLGGVSLLSSYGDKAYNQAPFMAVKMPNEINELYEEKAMFASGLIEAGLTAFDGNLWGAIDEAMVDGKNLTSSSTDLLKRDFVRRFNKFAHRFLDLPESNTDYMETYNRFQIVSTKISDLENKQRSMDKIKTDYVAYGEILSELKLLVAENSQLSSKLDLTDILQHIQASKEMTSDCLKDVYNLHKWVNITNNLGENIDWTKYLKNKEYTELNTLAGAACHGGNCDLDTRL